MEEGFVASSIALPWMGFKGFEADCDQSMGINCHRMLTAVCLEP